MSLSAEKFNILLTIMYYLRNRKEGSDFTLEYDDDGAGVVKFINVDAEELDIEFKKYTEEINCGNLDFNLQMVYDNRAGIESNLEEIKGHIGEHLGIEDDILNDSYEYVKEVTEKDGVTEFKELLKNIYKASETVDDFGKKIKKMIFKFNDLDNKELIIKGKPNNLDHLEYFIKSKVKCNVQSETIKGFKIWEDSCTEISIGGQKISSSNDSTAASSDASASKGEKKATGKDDSKGADSKETNVDEIVNTIFTNKTGILYEMFNTLRTADKKIVFKEGKKVKLVPGFNDCFNETFICNKDELFKGIKIDKKGIFSFRRKADREKTIKDVRIKLMSRFKEEIKKAEIGGNLFGKKLEYTTDEKEKNDSRSLKNEVKEKLRGLAIEDSRLKRVIFDSCICGDLEINDLIGEDVNINEKLCETMEELLEEELGDDYEKKILNAGCEEEANKYLSIIGMKIEKGDE